MTTVVKSRLEATGWVLALVVPILLWLSWSYVPSPGVLIAAGGIIGGFIGYLLIEHVWTRTTLQSRVVYEQLALAALLLVLFSFSL